MINLLRHLLAILAIGLINAILVTIISAIMFDIGTTSSSILYIVFGSALIVAMISGAVLAPLMLWIGEKLPKPKWFWLIIIGTIFGNAPYIIFVGVNGVEWEALLVFSVLGALSAVLWWYLVEKYRIDLEIKHG